MRELTATSFRQHLFSVLEDAAKSLPTRIHYKKGDSVLLPYHSYLALTQKDKKPSRGLTPLIPGKILKPLDEGAEQELLDYMGIK